MQRLARRPPARRLWLPDYDGQGWSPLDHVRRDSAGNPDLVCWYNPELSRGAASVGEQRADDAGPWGFDADTYTPAAGDYPKIERPAALGGRPAWRFNAGKFFRYLAPGSVAYGPAGNSKTLFVVAIINAASWPFSKSDSDGTDEATMALISTPYYDSGAVNDWVQAGSWTAGVGYVWVGFNNGGSHYIERNLTLQGSRGAGGGNTARTAQINLGAARGAAVFFNGWIADVVLYRRPLFDAERHFVTRKLAQRYGLAVV